MHMEFSELQRMLFAEQRKNIEMQNSMQCNTSFACACMHALYPKYHVCSYAYMHVCICPYTDMMKHMQSIFIDNAKSLGKLTSKCAQFHERCIPQKLQRSISRGIDACKHRDRRDKLQEQQKIGRDEAEQIMEEENLKDLDVWETCVPIPKTERTCRAITRKVTSQLMTANLESQGVHMHIHIHTYAFANDTHT